MESKAPERCRSNLRQAKSNIAPRKKSGAGEGIRTLDINLGKVALYQLSYARIN